MKLFSDFGLGQGFNDFQLIFLRKLFCFSQSSHILLCLGLTFVPFSSYQTKDSSNRHRKNKPKNMCKDFSE